MDKKLNKEIIDNVYQGAHIALQSISNVLPEVEEGFMRDELTDQYEIYEKFIGKLSTFMVDKGYEQKDVNPLKKAMLYTSVKMNTLTDDSSSHVAEMMVKGTVMGITELRQILSRSNGKVDEDILDYARELLDIEERFEKRLKEML